MILWKIEKTLCFCFLLTFQKATGSDTSEKAAGFVNLLLISLATFSTAYNVVLYHLFNPSFKAAIRETLLCACALGNSNRVQVVAVDIQQVNEKTKTNEELKQNGQPMVDDNGRNFIMTTSQI